MLSTSALSAESVDEAEELADCADSELGLDSYAASVKKGRTCLPNPSITKEDGDPCSKQT